jgi:hypothetical protein
VTANAYGSGDVLLAPAQVRVIRRANLLQTRTVSLPDTLVITGGQLEPKFVFLESPQRAHVLMVAGRNVPTSRSIFVTVEVP